MKEMSEEGRKEGREKIGKEGKACDPLVAMSPFILHVHNIFKYTLLI
jgi:hypothetical protein